MIKKTGKISSLLTVLVLSLLLIHNVLTASENRPDSINPKADQVIKKALNYISGLSSFQTEVDMNIKIEAQGIKQELVHKIVPDLTKAIEKETAQIAQFKNMKAEMEIVFKNWEVNIQIPDDTFIYTPPDDAKLAEPPGLHPLFGKPAPSFKLELLDGGEFDLSQQKDKNIVILDFWATWCGPCRRVMPIMEEVANEYKDKGVILIAVNLMERAQAIRSFLQEQGLHPTVALDKDGAVGNVYMTKFIPQTVIIGKDGIIQAVHVGNLPNLKETLKKELNDLLAGKKLASIKKPY